MIQSFTSDAGLILDCWTRVGTCNGSDGQLYFKIDTSNLPQQNKDSGLQK